MISKNVSKPDLPFRFGKIELRNTFDTLFIFGRKKMSFVVCFVCCNFVRSDFGLYYFFLIEALIELRKMPLTKKLFDLGTV